MTENAGNQIIAVLQWPRRDSFKPTDVVSLSSRVQTIAVLQRPWEIGRDANNTKLDKVNSWYLLSLPNISPKFNVCSSLSHKYLYLYMWKVRRNLMLIRWHRRRGGLLFTHPVALYRPMHVIGHAAHMKFWISIRSRKAEENKSSIEITLVLKPSPIKWLMPINKL